MEKQISIFKGKQIEFVVNNKNSVMVNATQMAKVYKKQVVAFLRNDSTKAFIRECLRSENSHFSNINSEKDILITSKRYGTKMHEVLALKFAAWLSPEFEVWVYSTIRDLLYKFAKDRDNSIKKTVALQQKKDKLTNKLAAKNNDFREYLNIEKQLKKEKNKRRKLTVEQFERADTLFQKKLF